MYDLWEKIVDFVQCTPLNLCGFRRLYPEEVCVFAGIFGIIEVGDKFEEFSSCTIGAVALELGFDRGMHRPI